MTEYIVIAIIIFLSLIATVLYTVTKKNGSAVTIKPPSGGSISMPSGLPITTSAVVVPNPPVPTKVNEPPVNNTSVVFYEGDNGKQKSWKVLPGLYSHKKKGGFKELPFPNDEVRSVRIPAGYVVYVTDKDNFLLSNLWLGWGPGLFNLDKPAGKVSSVAVWRRNDGVPNFIPAPYKLIIEKAKQQGKL